MPSFFTLANCRQSRQNQQRYIENIQFISQQYKQYAKMSQSSRVVTKALENKDARVRFTVLLVVADQGRPLHDKYLEMLQDDDALVRQAARRALILCSADRLSPGWRSWTLQKRAKAEHVDFGPTPCSTAKEIEGSVELWKTWLEEQEEKVAPHPSISKP